MGSFFAYYKVEKYKNICHLQQNACNMLVDKQLERCRYLRQMRCRYFICNALYNQRKSLDSFMQSYGIIGMALWIIYSVPMEKRQYPYVETVVSCLRNARFLRWKLQFPASEQEFSCWRKMIHIKPPNTSTLCWHRYTQCTNEHGNWGIFFLYLRHNLSLALRVLPAVR